MFLSTSLEEIPYPACVIEVPSLRFIQANQSYCRSVSAKAIPASIVGKAVMEVLTSPSGQALEALYLAHTQGKPSLHGSVFSKSLGNRHSYWTATVLPIKRKQNSTQVFACLNEFEQNSTTVLHDLRTPLTSLKISTQMLLRHFSEVSTEDVLNRLAFIDEQASKLAKKLSALLEKN